jgi:catechol 2,3-dioxygenase-like lactoylglutathione lyase family enzyme
MKRLHVMLRVKDLDEATRFYSTLFGADPTKRESDYAKWMLDDPRVNFSVAEKETDHGVEHLGIQAETPAELEELRGRIDRAGGTINNEGETTCCYANSDKTWVVDQQGVSWEAFYTHGVAATYGDEAAPNCC